jgi:hypothetical protein
MFTENDIAGFEKVVDALYSSPRMSEIANYYNEMIKKHNLEKQFDKMSSPDTISIDNFNGHDIEVEEEYRDRCGDYINERFTIDLRWFTTDEWRPLVDKVFEKAIEKIRIKKEEDAIKKAKEKIEKAGKEKEKRMKMYEELKKEFE